MSLDVRKRKCVAITGGASGLGKAMALYFAQQGWCVAISDVNQSRGEETLNQLRTIAPDALFTQVNVCDEQSVSQWCSQIKAHWGQIDVLINNAGIGLPGGINENAMNDWQKIVDINFLGVVRGCRVFGEQFKKQGFGHIVNIASMAGLLHLPNVSSYSACKAAVVALSESMKFELLPYKVNVTVVCPGLFKTNLGESVTDPAKKADLETMMGKTKVSADDIAMAVFNGVKNNRFMVFTHKFERTVWWVKRYIPFLYYYVLKAIGNHNYKQYQEKAKIINPDCS